jgi:SnoaL-like domain
MKRCPTCQRIYTDDTLRFCLEDGAALLTESASTDQTLLLDSSQASAEPPPTEILDYAVPPTVLAPNKEATLRRQKPAPTVRQQGRPTVKEFAHGVAPVGSSPKQRSTTSVVAVTVIATVLLLGIGGLGAWLILKDKNSSSNVNDQPRNGNVSTNTTPGNTNSSNKNSNTTVVLTTPTPTPNATPQTDIATARKEVMQALNGWTGTMKPGALDAHMAYYASTLHTYYLQSNVSSSRVRGYIEPAFSKYTNMDVKLSNMQIDVDPSGTSATATFDKTFTFTGDNVYSGSGLNRFWFEKINGRWLITGEKDLKTYYVNK